MSFDTPDNLFSKSLLFLLLVITLSGCVTTQAPKISHVHVGHAMTGWRDTPNEQGLFITAEHEAQIAYQHAQYAVESSHNIALMKEHISHVQHAIDPEVVAAGPGLGYGFIKAVSSARDHLLFAADSKDASDNIRASARLWSVNVESLIARSRLIMELSKEIHKSASHEEVMVLTDEVLSLARKNLEGYDSDNDGTIGNIKQDFGIKQLHEEMNIMLAKEDPPYQTVDKKYLFGLIRLPSGEWIFKQDNSTNNDALAY